MCSHSTQKIIFPIIFFIEDKTFNTLSNNDNFQNVYQIVISKISKSVEPFDLKFSETIKQIMLKFLSNKENVIIYFCSVDDKKEVKRFNAFNRWYNSNVAKNYIQKSDNLIFLDNTIVYTSLIFHEKNCLKKEIPDLYYQLEQLLNNDKR